MAETGLTDEFEKLANVLTECLRELADRHDKRIQVLENAIVTAIKPGQQLDPETTFWNGYKKVADEYDAEFQKKYQSNLDASLVFAGLFSAVSSAFIIQIQPELQQDPNVITQALLRILIHAVNSSVIVGDDPALPEWPGPPAEIVTVESLLYASLSATLLAALLAVLGKQWLAYYDSVGARGTIGERGLERQKKFDGFRKWGFELVMAALPIFLQLALLLFGAALSRYLWTVNATVATVVLSLTSFGMASYVFFAISSIFWKDSPFRTPLSDFINLVLRFIGLVLRFCSPIFLFATLWIYPLYSKYRRMRMRSRERRLDRAITDRDICNLKVKAYDPTNVLEHREDPIFVQSEVDRAYEAAVFWTLDTSTDPELVYAAALGVTAITWQPTRDVLPALNRFGDNLKATSPVTLRTSSEYRAIAYARACYQWHPFCPAFYPQFSDFILDGQVSDDWSPEMRFTFSFLKDWYAGVFFKDVIDLLTRRLYYSRQSNRSFNVDQMEYIREMEYVVYHLVAVNRNAFSRWLLCLGVYCGIAIHPHDLAVFDKSAYCKNMLEAVLTHFAKFLSHIPDQTTRESNDAFGKLRLNLGIIIVLFMKLDSSLQYELLWEALYMFMAISRFQGDTSRVCHELERYLRYKKRRDERFVDPEWRKMSTDFERCHLDGVLGGISENMYLEQSVVIWEGREMYWRRTEIGFTLMQLYPHPRTDDLGPATPPSIEACPIAEDSAHQSIDNTGIPLIPIHSDQRDRSNLSSVSVEHPPAISA